MEPEEPYYMACERFNALLNVQYAVGGHIKDKKDPEECEELFESFAQAEKQQPSTRNSIPSARTPTSATRVVHQVNTDTSMVAVLAAMAKEIKELKTSAMKCEVCRGGHDTIYCPVAQQEQYGRDRNGGHNSGSSSGENEIKEMLATQTQLLAQLVKTDQETQVGDIACQLTEKSGGSFSSSTETNPKAYLKAVTTHSCKGLESEKTPASDDDEPVDEEIEMETPEGAHERRVPASTVPKGESPAEKEENEGKKKTPDVDLSRVPYPASLMQ
ncbi:hypothetical protein L1987_78362 [Smallanthus sonchifolius]|uniref:Uncharacterized protein n=1 Tax=Smallanthus sonchifolius TaxID=185202 RepID=A0ACB8ZDI4_9ASTR|nr:hypothetical protein L1987_78362 [Smallanthus sonchifolius]